MFCFYQPLEFHDGRLWSSLVMFKLSSVNQDQCPFECSMKYQETKNAPNVLKTMIEKVGKVINDTDDVIQRMRNSDFSDDLSKYKDISQLVRDLYTTFSNIPKTNRLMAKWMMKMIGGDKKDRRRRPSITDGRRPSIHNPNNGHCSTEPVVEMIENLEEDGNL